MDTSYFDRPAIAVAADLIGVTFMVDGVGGLIVETEAYDNTDPASHSYVRQTPRNATMFGPAAHAYVYRSYGMHWCVNITCGGDTAAAVLIRALQPTHGLDRMAERRGLTNPALLCAGPGRLCQALGITRAMDGVRIDQPPFGWIGSLQKHPVIAGPRIGITKGVKTPWRFCLAQSRFLSKPARGVPHDPVPHSGA